MSTLEDPRSADGLDTAPFMAFLPKKLLIRYLISRDKTLQNDNEFLSYNVLYVGQGHGPPFEAININHSISYFREFKDNSFVLYNPVLGNQARMEQLLLSRLQHWKHGAVCGHQPQMLWLEPIEFVGVLKEGKKSQKLDAANPHCMHVHFHIATKLNLSAARAQQIASEERSLKPKADALERMAKRFSTFAALSRHEMANKQSV